MVVGAGRTPPRERVWWRVVPVVGEGGDCEGRKTMKAGEKEGRKGTAMNTNCCRMEGHQGRKDIKEGDIKEGRKERKKGRIPRKEGDQGRKEGRRYQGKKER